MNDDSEVLMWFFLVLVGISLLIAVGALAAVVWLVISAISVHLRKSYLRQKALERFEERLAREGANVPVDDVFGAMGIAGVDIDSEGLDGDDFLGGVLLGMGSTLHNE